MRRQSVSESSALKILESELGSSFRVSDRSSIRIGIGDDCAMLAPFKSKVLWTMDGCFEGSHFLWDWMSPEDVAHKAFHAALSDIPAMGGRGKAALCQLTLTPKVDPRWLRRFARRQAEVSAETKTPIVGGNICFGESFQVVTTVLGSIGGGALRRDGAQCGDEIWLVGEVGLARAGLLILQKGLARKRGNPSAINRCLSAFRRPRSQWDKGARLLKRANACMDISDGIRRDLQTLARSSELRAVLQAELLNTQLPKELLALAPILGEAALTMAIEGGEDYSLLATGPGRRRPSFARVIGRMEKGEGAFLEEGRRCRRLLGGFEHGKKKRTRGS